MPPPIICQVKAFGRMDRMPCNLAFYDCHGDPFGATDSLGSDDDVSVAKVPTFNSSYSAQVAHNTTITTTNNHDTTNDDDLDTPAIIDQFIDQSPAIPHDNIAASSNSIHDIMNNPMFTTLI